MMQRLDIRALALAIGLCWGSAMVLVGISSSFGWGVEFVEVMGSIYVGFEPSFMGAIIGGLWGFADGMIAGFIIAALYNLFARPS